MGIVHPLSVKMIQSARYLVRPSGFLIVILHYQNLYSYDKQDIDFL